MTSKERGLLIADKAMAWLGTPYANNAMVKGAGIDCGHLLYASLIDAGLIDKSKLLIEDYSNEWHLHRSEEKFLKYVEKVCDKVKSPQVGDFFLYQYGRCISHGAILTESGLLLHAYVDKGVILSEANDVIFYDNAGKSRLRGYWRFNPKKVGA